MNIQCRFSIVSEIEKPFDYWSLYHIYLNLTFYVFECNSFFFVFLNHIYSSEITSKGSSLASGVIQVRLGDLECGLICSKKYRYTMCNITQQYFTNLRCVFSSTRWLKLCGISQAPSSFCRLQDYCVRKMEHLRLSRLASFVTQMCWKWVHSAIWYCWGYEYVTVLYMNHSLALFSKPWLLLICLYPEILCKCNWAWGSQPNPAWLPRFIPGLARVYAVLWRKQGRKSRP